MDTYFVVSIGCFLDKPYFFSTLSQAFATASLILLQILSSPNSS